MGRFRPFQDIQGCTRVLQGTGRDVVWAHSSPFSLHRAHPWVPPPIKYRSLQKTSTSKPKVRFLRKKRRRKREKVCFSLVWCRWFTQKWRDGHAWMGRRDGSRERRSDARTDLGQCRWCSTTLHPAPALAEICPSVARVNYPLDPSMCDHPATFA